MQSRLSGARSDESDRGISLRPALAAPCACIDNHSDEEGVQMSDIDVKYAALGGSAGWLGPATTAELVAPDGIGHYRHFRSGSIY